MKNDAGDMGDASFLSWSKEKGKRENGQRQIASRGILRCLSEMA
jgi:hypothetical protein